MSVEIVIVYICMSNSYWSDKKKKDIEKEINAFRNFKTTVKGKICINFTFLSTSYLIFYL